MNRSVIRKRLVQQKGAGGRIETRVRDMANAASCFVVPFIVGMNDDLDQKQREAANQRHRQNFGEIAARVEFAIHS